MILKYWPNYGQYFIMIIWEIEWIDFVSKLFSSLNVCAHQIEA